MDEDQHPQVENGLGQASPGGSVAFQVDLLQWAGGSNPEKALFAEEQGFNFARMVELRRELQPPEDRARQP